MNLSLLHANDRSGRHADSWYAASANAFPEFEPREGEQRFDIAIIGAGYSGLSSALHLAQKGYRVAVLDAHRVGWGASGRNGGQVASGQRLDQDELEKLVGEPLARQAFAIGVEAAETVRRLIRQHGIDCAYRPGVIEANHRHRYDAHAQAYVEKLRREYDYHSLSYLPPDQLREKLGATGYAGGIADSAAGHLHPLNYARGLAGAARSAGAHIFERSEVEEIAAGNTPVVKTKVSSIRCDWVILACNGYLGNLNSQIAARAMPINNFIIATEPLDESLARSLIRDGEAVADSRFVVNYFRLSQDNRLLFGGGKSYGYRFPTDIKGFVRPKMLQIFPQLQRARIDYGWGGTLAITRNRLPQFSIQQGNILNISGYSGSGVSMATMAGKIAAEAIDGQMARFDVMASLPTPKFPGGSALRWPILVAAMAWYSLRDRL